MKAALALELYELLFGVAMALGIVWMVTGHYRGPRRWVYALNRFSFWIWTAALTAALFFAFKIL